MFSTTSGLSDLSETRQNGSKLPKEQSLAHAQPPRLLNIAAIPTFHVVGCFMRLFEAFPKIFGTS
jgi:hypothetical protein